MYTAGEGCGLSRKKSSHVDRDPIGAGGAVAGHEDRGSRISSTRIGDRNIIAADLVIVGSRQRSPIQIAVWNGRRRSSQQIPCRLILHMSSGRRHRFA